jgi:hypothetical protein
MAGIARHVNCFYIFKNKDDYWMIPAFESGTSEEFLQITLPWIP